MAISIKKWILPVLLLSCFHTTAQHRLNLVKEEVRIPMRDGIELGGILLRPEQAGKYPALVYRTPYGATDYESYAAFPVKAARRGYAVFMMNVRGRYTSEGSFEAYRNEQADGYDLIEWIASSEYCNGKVGTFGGSYPGIVQWQALSQQPPHLLAASPTMTPISSHHFFYYGGAFSHLWLDWFLPYILPDKRRRAGDHSGPWEDAAGETAWEAADKRKWYGYRPLVELPLLQAHAPEYYEWLRHPDKTDWWDFVDVEDDFNTFSAPVFLVSGWYDAAYGPEGATRAFNKMKTEAATAAARQQTRLVLGPWNHTSLHEKKTSFGELDFGTSAGFGYDEVLLDWFDEQLKGKKNPTPYPPVSIFVMGANEWRAEEVWPLSRAKPTSWYLQSSGSVAMDKQAGELKHSIPEMSGENSFVFDPNNPFWDESYAKSYPYDQRDNENRRDVLVYTSPPLDSDLEVTGEIVAELYVSSTAKDTDFAITLSDVYPDGRSINLSGLDAGYLRMRYRNGFEQQELMEPGTIYKIRIGNLYTANLFKKGHRIRLSVTSSKAPHYDPNPNTGTQIATEAILQPCTNSVHLGGSYPSRIILPVVESTKK